MITIDPTTRGGVIPTGDRLVVSRERIRRIIAKAGPVGRDGTLWETFLSPDERSCYAKGVVDALSILLRPDTPDEMLADLLGFDEALAYEAVQEQAEEERIEAERQADLQREHGRLRSHRSVGMPRRI